MVVQSGEQMREGWNGRKAGLAKRKRIWGLGP